MTKRKIFVMLIFAFYLSSCTVTKTYKLDRYYSEDRNDPDRKILDEKLVGLFNMIDNCVSCQQPCFVVNGDYLTFKVKKKCSKKIDTIIPYTLCNRKLGTECKLEKVHR